VPTLVALTAAPGPDFVDALRRIWDRGDTVLPVDRRLPEPALQRLVEAMSVASIHDGDTEHPVSVGRPTEPGDALVVATSGSTGAAKGVVLTHTAVEASARLGSTALGVAANDRWLACLPLSHLAGLGVVTRSIYCGTPIEIHDGFDAARVESAARGGATLTTLVPTALARVDASLFRRIVAGGAEVPAARPPNVVTSYGLTETCGGCVYDGRPFEGVEVEVRDDHIYVRGPVVMRSYRDGRRGLRADGWLDTGDLGHLDALGRLVVDGRRDDLIITGGENVWPGPVEDSMRSLPGVVDVAVIGRPDPEWGQRVVAVIELEPGAALPSLEVVRGHVKEVLPAYCAPRQVDVADALPRTAAGKVRRAALRTAQAETAPEGHR